MGQNPDPPRATFEQEVLSAIEAVHRFALHLPREPSRAEDLAQETYLRALAHRDQYQPGTNCRAWLFTICRNAFLKGARHSDREVATEDAALEAVAAAGIHAGMAGSPPPGAGLEPPAMRGGVAG